MNLAAAQSFGISFQLGAGTPANLSGKVLFEANFELQPDVTAGVRLAASSSPLAQALSFRLNPFVSYRNVFYSDGQWWLSGYGSAQVNFFLTPLAAPVANTSSNRTDDINEPGDDDVQGRGPLPTPTDPVALGLLGIAGLDAAYFLDESNAFYFGFETDTSLPNLFAQTATVAFSIFPYAEFDHTLMDGLTLSLGGYLCWSPSKTPSFGYLSNFNVFYTFATDTVLHLEIGFDGNIFGNLKFSYRF